MDDPAAAARLVFTVPRNLAADDVAILFEMAPTLNGPWQSRPGDFSLLREMRSSNKVVRQSFLMTEPVTAGTAFVRLSIRRFD
jgi:hypothetical protein